MKTALVTGVMGFVGRHVADELVEHGWHVRGLIRGAHPRRFRATLLAPKPRGEIDLCPGNVLDADRVAQLAMGCDAIFHCAAHYSLARSQAASVTRINVVGTANVIAAARASGARLVHTSSVATIGVPDDGSSGDEDTPLDPALLIGAYKRSKLTSEQLVLNAARDGLWATVVNPTAPVGPWDWKPTPTGRIIRDFLRGRMKAYVDTGLNLVDVRDVAAGHRLAFEHGHPGRRYILGNCNLTLLEILQALSEISGVAAPTRRIPHAIAVGFAGISEVVEGYGLRREPFAPLDGARMARKRIYASPARAIEELGLPQSSVVEALRDAVAWWRSPMAGPRAVIVGDPR